MRSAFASHFGSDDAKQVLWDNCIFVFDTNVLSSLYKRSDEARNALLKILESLGDRIWIPNQVAYEFLRNRPSIVHEQSCLYGDAVKKLTDFLKDLESNTKHPFLDGELYRSFVDISCKVVSSLEDKSALYESKLVDDGLKERLADLLEGKVGDPYDDAKLRELIKQGEFRYANQLPPGYEDASKHKGSPIFEHARARYGDFIIWAQILDYAKVNKVSVILVTGDQKEDWWLRVGGKTLSPRPELMAEFKSEVGAEFYMYSHSKFLSLANGYLDQRTSLSVINEIRENEDASLDSGINGGGEDDDDFFLPWEISYADRLRVLTQHEERLRLKFEAAARNFAAAVRKTDEAKSPVSRKRAHAEATFLANEREHARLELMRCRARLSKLQSSEFDDLI